MNGAAHASAEALFQALCGRTASVYYEDASDDSDGTETAVSSDDRSDEVMTEASQQQSDEEEEETKDERSSGELSNGSGSVVEGVASTRGDRYLLRSRAAGSFNGAAARPRMARSRLTVTDTHPGAEQRARHGLRASAPSGRRVSMEQDGYDSVPDLVSCSSSSGEDAD